MKVVLTVLITAEVDDDVNIDELCIEADYEDVRICSVKHSGDFGGVIEYETVNVERVVEEK